MKIYIPSRFPSGNFLLITGMLALILLLSACTTPSQPAASQATALPGQSGPPESYPAAPVLSTQDFLATREAALDSSGKTGPTLPPGDLPQQPAQPPDSASPTSASVPSDEGSQGTPYPAQSTPGGSPAALSSDELATREAALEQNSKPGPSTPVSTCLGGAALLLPLAGIILLKRLPSR